MYTMLVMLYDVMVIFYHNTSFRCFVLIVDAPTLCVIGMRPCIKMVTYLSDTTTFRYICCLLSTSFFNQPEIPVYKFLY